MHETLAVAVGSELRAMRKRAGISRLRFAELIDSFGATVSRFEHGHNVPSLEICLLYSAVTGESLRGVGLACDRVYGLTGSKPPPPPAPRRRVFARAPRS